MGGREPVAHSDGLRVTPEVSSNSLQHREQKMKYRNHLMLGLLALTLCHAAFASDSARQESEQARLSAAAGIPTEARFAMDRAVAPVKSEQDLVEFMAKSGQDNPLTLLSPDARKAFINSLVFTDSGLASFNHAILERELTATESYAVLELFGFQEAVSKMRNEKAESPLDAQLNFYCEIQSIGGAQCDDTPYVDGICVANGTCWHDTNATCHPPSC
jgi:hypothetical protein